MMIRNNFYKNLLLVASIVFFSACQADLQNNLSQKQADQIIVALQRYGIKSDKKEHVKSREITYSVLTGKGQLNEARRILVTLGLPRERIIGIEDICGNVDALIPSPSIDRCKLQLAVQNEIVKAIHAIDGVVEARVNVNIPESNILSEQDNPHPTAAVLIKYIADEAGRAPFDPKKIKEFVANSVDNLDYNDVTIMSTAARAIDIRLVGKKTHSFNNSSEEKTSSKGISTASGEGSVLGMHVDHQSVKRAKILILMVTVCFLFLSAGVIAAIVYAKRLKVSNDRLLKRHRRMQVHAKRSLNPAPRNLSQSPKVKREEKSVTPGEKKEDSEESKEVSDPRFTPSYSDQPPYGVN